MPKTASEYAHEFARAKTEGCIEWPLARNVFGYGILRHKGTARLANRVVCELAHGAPKKPKLEAAHSCGNRGCVNPAHLRWATHTENMRDKVKHNTNRAVWGETHPGAKLKLADVQEIINRLVGGETPSQIAPDYGVTIQNIAAIRDGKTWPDVPRPATYSIGSPIKGGAVIVTISEKTE